MIDRAAPTLELNIALFKARVGGSGSEPNIAHFMRGLIAPAQILRRGTVSTESSSARPTRLKGAMFSAWLLSKGWRRIGLGSPVEVLES